MDDKIKQLLQDLGTAINESISGSDDVNQHIQRIRDEGYDLYVVLDATIGLNKQEPETRPLSHYGFGVTVSCLRFPMINSIGFHTFIIRIRPNFCAFPRC